MARGLVVHKAGKATVSALGRDRSRRARSECALCAGGVRRTVLEIPPRMAEPALERAVLLCERCRALRDGGLKRAEPVWSEVLPAQLMSASLLRGLAEHGLVWSQQAAGDLWLDEEIEALV